jgi:Zinc-finger of C2H2 type
VNIVAHPLQARFRREFRKMGKTKQVQKIIVDELEQSPKGKSHLKKVVKAKDPGLKKYLKKALRKLVKKGVVEENENALRMVSVQQEDLLSWQHHLVNPQPDVGSVPIAVRLRKEQEEAPKKKVVAFADEEVDLDDEIRRLEAELDQSSVGSSDDESTATNDGGAGNPAVLSLSAFANDRVERLSDTYLPEPGRYRSQGPAIKKKSQKKIAAEPRSETREKVDGLKEAVKEVLSGYTARSSERLPFYCRFCAKQYNDEIGFLEHKSSDFHKMAVDMERKATYCRLCQKQLTSPDQMKEHLKSRPHHERLQKVRNRQAANATGRKNMRNENRTRQWT